MGRVGAILLVIAAIALPSVGSAQKQKLYKWRDENGVIQFSDIPPPPTRDRSAEADKRAADESAQRDRTLLENYSSVGEIEDVRNRRIEEMESQIRGTEDYLGKLRERLVALQADASKFKPYSTREDAAQIPENLALEISQTEAAIPPYEQALTSKRADQAAMTKSFDADIARFRELKGE